MRDILNLIATCGIIILVGLAVKGTIENQFTSQTVQHDSPMILDEAVELPERKVEQQKGLPHTPRPPMSFASSRMPICLSSILVLTT